MRRRGPKEQDWQALADRYLGDDHSMAEISFLLGFSEPSAFFRAFKRWTGLTPIERRQQRRGGDSILVSRSMMAPE